jgi:hypothetical protein
LFKRITARLRCAPYDEELLTVNMRQNLQIVVNICKEYTEQLTAESIISMLEETKVGPAAPGASC